MDHEMTTKYLGVLREHVFFKRSQTVWFKQRPIYKNTSPSNFEGFYGFLSSIEF